MAIEPIQTPADAAPLISDLIRDHGAALPVTAYTVLAAYYPSPVVRSVQSAEALYAAATQLSAGAAQTACAVACAQLADMCTTHAFHNIGQTDRGLRMSGACRRIAGEGSQDEGLDPEGLAEFLPEA